MNNKVTIEKITPVNTEKVTPAAIGSSAELKQLYDIIHSLQDELEDLKKTAHRTVDDDGPQPTTKMGRFKRTIKRQFKAVPGIVFENLRENFVNYLISILLAGGAANVAVEVMQASSLEEVKKIAENMERQAMKSVEEKVESTVAGVNNQMETVKLLQKKMTATESMVKANSQCYGSSATVQSTNKCLKQQAEAFEQTLSVSAGGQPIISMGATGGAASATSSTSSSDSGGASSSDSGGASSSDSGGASSSDSSSASSSDSSSASSSDSSSASSSDSSSASSSDSSSANSSSAGSKSTKSTNSSASGQLRAEASGDCSANQVVDSNLSTLLSNNTVCQTAGGDEPHGAQEQHLSNGQLWDYKMGSSDPVDPSTQIGNWSVSGSGAGTVVNYSYLGGGGSGSYKVYNNGGVYDFCSDTTRVATVTVKSGTASGC